MVRLSDFEMRLSLNGAAFDAVISSVREGMTENEVKALIRKTWDSAAGRCVPYSGDIVSGTRASEIGGDATDRILRSGDCLILDLQPGFDSCFADTTRTFFMGELRDDIKKCYDAALFALSETEKYLRPGTPACDIYNAMQTSLGKFGFSCPHHAGHALGEEMLMMPEFLPEIKEPVTEGMFVALEPGIYVDGDFGLRIENNYLITRDGAKNLFNYPLQAEKFILK